MGVKLSSLFPIEDLIRAVGDGLVVSRPHPTWPLIIYNYTERCQYERGNWNRVTRACRGLIVDHELNVVARPFPKFFNYEEATDTPMPLDAPVTVYDKLDGSLGILYQHFGCKEIATRGSFESEQAKHATELLNTKYASFNPRVGWTYLFEIIFPANRIVVDYGQRDEPVLLGVINNETGQFEPPFSAIGMAWTGPHVFTFSYRTLAEVLAAKPRPNSEGLVVHFTDTNTRVKLKQADYVALHKIVCGLNERAVWEWVKDGKSIPDLQATLPDEFHGWVSEVGMKLHMEVERRVMEVEREYWEIMKLIPLGMQQERKAFALLVEGNPLAPLLFMRYNGKALRAKLWKDVRPAGGLGPRGLSPNDGEA